MRILFAGQTYAPATNGPAVFTAGLAEALVRCGHQVAAVVPSPVGRRRLAVRDGVAVHALPAVVARRLGVAVTAFPDREVRRLMSGFAPDVVHVQDHYPTSRAVLAAARARGVPVVGTNHFVPENIALQLPLPAAARRPAEATLWRTVRAVFTRLDVVTVPSRTAAARLAPHLPGVAVQVISCGVDVARFRPRAPAERAALREGLGLPPSTSVGLYVGRVDSDKNVALLVSAMALTDEPELLLIAGKGLQLESLRRRVRRAGLAARIRFLGYVEDAALPELYAASDVFVMPSAVELLSIATLEAMACGLPVAAARAGALPELVEDGVTGALFDPADAASAAAALRALAGERAAWPRLAAGARQRAEGHRLERTRERFEALYASLAGVPASTQLS